jgi:hypothetical protein
MGVEQLSGKDPYIEILRAILNNAFDTSENPDTVGSVKTSYKYQILCDNVWFAKNGSNLIATASDLFDISEEAIRDRIISLCKQTLDKEEFMEYEKNLVYSYDHRYIKRIGIIKVKKARTPRTNEWSNGEVNYLKKMYKSKTAEYISSKLGRSINSIRCKLQVLRKNGITI